MTTILVVRFAASSLNDRSSTFDIGPRKRAPSRPDVLTGTSYSVRGFMRNLVPRGPVSGKPRVMGAAEPHCVQGTCAKECLCRPPPPLAAAVRVGMLVSSPVDMDVRLDQYVGRHQHYPAVPYPALGDHVLGEMLDLVSLAAQDRDLHATVVVEMRVHRSERQFVVIVEGVGQPL